MNFDITVTITESSEYPPEMVSALLQEAARQGHPLKAGSYIGQLTIRQLDNLVHGRTDA